ncbi:leucine-rich repeat-containing protein 15-like [Anoplophora glabripennis]|uniref:leucine-rich repeat-containing protein 15-like n=1 Tax=Anoplophora glabripennis TaxID=217634 RepID=UPI00087454E6|nr:leucine-rich repeat-containing protein 15-like [Anoplophora glabripennis]XP_018573067.1 leucine-rich repeat-containing protein 15-like [Anoplophora glabripennis]
MYVKLMILACLAVQTYASRLCPTKCTCYLDQKGRTSVLCKEGGMVGPLNLNNVSLDTEVIKIIAPEDNMNELTMSPVFQSYKNLEEIHITKSNVPQLGMHFFWGLDRLDVLNLTQNNITQPLDHNFRGLSRLKELYLDDNRIISLPSGTFRHLRELKVLSVQRNRIEELTPRIFLEIGKLKVLKLSGNNLKVLNPEVFKDVQELRHLECRGCTLNQLDNDIYHLLPHLAYLDLGNNYISTLLPEEMKDLTRLKHFKLDGNQITTIHDSTFAQQFALRKLNLARNQIERIYPNAFENLDNLTELDLGYNKLERLGFLEPVADTLEVLVLSGNRLRVTALQELLKVESLRELRLAECGLADIPLDIFPKGLSVLDLSGNYLGALPSELLPPILSELDLSSNRFRGLGEDVLILLDNIQTLRLNNNSWSCDLCHIVPLLDRINRSAVFRDIICLGPYTVRNKKLGFIQKNELTWCTASSHTTSDANFYLIGEDGKVGIIAASTSVCLLFLTVLAIVGALCYSKRHAAKYYTHEDKLAVEGESIFDNNHSPLFCDGELSFKFPLDTSEKKVSIATIDEIKKEHTITNGS